MTTLTYAELGVTEPEPGIIEFTVLPEHIKLLRNSVVAYMAMDNAPGGSGIINPVRPYGTKDVYEDMRSILGWETEYPEFVSREGVQHCLETLHKQTALVLQIVLTTGKFKPTRYRAPKYSQNWKEYTEKKEKKHAKRESSEDGAVSPEGES